ncbi:3beta-hydroxysteroid-dehydrogenase/decarboxylase isoform [Lachnellula subtilissima]|uniref:3beta-hydroxysteroid-dehydrogenase/decarboxylase isoform n=1 Tax=Lachnellula subtilissima TaxID=602034 RepID=A0A8H8S1V8_9HELO|nr:3beta-hydroxysteroid-dehydrogenase/decarboxylase isoform [Lachnellula subtilissima]
MSFPSLSPVLVIGGCGGLGHHLVQLLVEDSTSSDIAVLDINTKNNRIDGVKYLEGSLSSRHEVLQAIQEVKPRLYTKVNVHGTTLLLECIKTVGVTKALIYTSSSSVIHNNMTDLVNATEDIPLCFEPEQTEYYTHTKAAAEQTILSENKQNQLLTTIIRAAMLFGEGDATSTPQLVGNARAGRGKFQIGNGTNLFDFTYIGNTAYAHVLAAMALLRESAASEPAPEDSKVNGEAFVITNHDPWPFWDYTKAIGAAAGHPVKKKDIVVVPASAYSYFVIILEWAAWVFSFGLKESVANRRMVKHLTMTRIFDISKTKKRLGYRSQVSMQEGI